MRLIYTALPQLWWAGVSVLLISLAGSAGCATNPYLASKSMGGQGYAIWYPAESGIEPGQIWLYDGTLPRNSPTGPIISPFPRPSRPISRSKA